MKNIILILIRREFNVIILHGLKIKEQHLGKNISMQRCRKIKILEHEKRLT